MEEDFEKVRKKAEEFYKSISAVYCPYFKERIVLNALGFEHIKLKSWKRPRLKEDQYMRLKLLKYIPQILENSKTVQGISQLKEFVRQKKYGRWEAVLTNVYYYEFIAVLDNKRIKIVIKQIEDGEKFFWTIIPYWKKGKFNNRKLFEGNPETD